MLFEHFGCWGVRMDGVEFEVYNFLSMYENSRSSLPSGLNISSGGLWGNAIDNGGGDCDTMSTIEDSVWIAWLLCLGVVG